MEGRVCVAHTTYVEFSEGFRFYGTRATGSCNPTGEGTKLT